MERFKYLLLALLLGVTLTVFLIFARTENQAREPVQAAESLPQNVNMQLTGLNFTEVDQLGREWAMQAQSLHYFKDDDLMLLDRVKATFYGSDGPVHILGDKGYYYKTQKTVRLTGAVSAEDAQGRRLVTGEISYDLTSGVLVAPGYFELRGPRLDLDGFGLTVYVRESRYRVNRQANVMLKPVGKVM